MDVQEVYADIRRLMFNCATLEAQMHLDNLKGVQGEIGLRLGDNEYFGVINVGDDRDLVKLCEQNGILASDKDFSGSLFSSTFGKAFAGKNTHWVKEVYRRVE